MRRVSKVKTKKKWLIEYDNNRHKIIKDEEYTEDKYCHEYYFVNHGVDPSAEGYGVISYSRRVCIKKLLRILNNKVKDTKKLLKQQERDYGKLYNLLEAECYKENANENNQ